MVVDVCPGLKAEISPTQVDISRQEWIKRIRLAFCRRPEFEKTQTMIDEKGFLNQE
jgi:hypothetical protein